MKTFLFVLLAVIFITLTWISLGWIALLVIPALALFALMTFAPLLTAWAQNEDLRSSDPAIENYSAPC